MTSKNSNTPIINQTKDVVIETYNNRNIKGLTYCNKDINEWAKSLSQSDLEELNDLLRNKFGEDLVRDSSKILSKIKQIIKNGKIANEEEYRLLLNRVEEIHTNINKKSEIETLNKLLADYHR